MAAGCIQDRYRIDRFAQDDTMALGCTQDGTSIVKDGSRLSSGCTHDGAWVAQQYLGGLRIA